MRYRAIIPTILALGAFAADIAFSQTNPIPAVYLTDRPVWLPPDPVSLAKSSTPGIRDWLHSWTANELKGQGAGPDQITSLQTLLGQGNDLRSLAGIVQLVAAMDGNSIAAPLFQGVLERAEKELHPGDSRSIAAAAALWSMHDLFWGMEDYQSDVRLVHTLLQFEKRGSGHSQWAHYIYAELLFYLKRNEESFQAYKDLQAERANATEPSEGINRPLEWELALTASAAGHHLEAAEYFQTVAGQHDFPAAQAASADACIELYAAGKHEEAIQKFKDHVVLYHLSREQAVEVASRFKDGLSNN